MCAQACDRRLSALLNECNETELRPLYDLLEDAITGRCSTPTELARELRRDGSNTIFTWLRFGEPVHYLEVVQDVAGKLKADPCANDDEREWELAILAKVVDEYLKNASEAEREEVEKILRDAAKDGHEWGKHVTSGIGTVITMLLQTAGRKAAEKVILQVLTRMMVKQTARTLTGMAIPFLNVLMSLWLVLDIAGPAYRKTIPAVIRIALLRLEVDGRRAGGVA